MIVTKEVSHLTEEEIVLLQRNNKWMKVVLELWNETREGKNYDLTEYGYYYSLLDKGIITNEEFNTLTDKE